MDAVPVPAVDSPPEAFAGVLRDTGLSQAEVARSAALHPSVLNRFLRRKGTLSRRLRVRLLLALEALLYPVWGSSPRPVVPTPLPDGRQDLSLPGLASPSVEKGDGVSNRRYLARMAAIGLPVDEAALVGRRLDDLPDVLTVNHLARLFDCSASTIRRRVGEGLFPVPPIAAIDYRYRWSRLQIRRWLERGGPHPPRRRPLRR